MIEICLLNILLYTFFRLLWWTYHHNYTVDNVCLLMVYSSNNCDLFMNPTYSQNGDQALCPYQTLSSGIQSWRPTQQRKYIVLSLVPGINEKKRVENLDWTHNNRKFRRKNRVVPELKSCLLKAVGKSYVFWPCDQTAQPCVIRIIRHIARYFPPVCGLALEENCGKDKCKMSGATSLQGSSLERCWGCSDVSILCSIVIDL